MKRLKHFVLVVLMLITSISYCAFAQTSGGTTTNPKISFASTGKVWTGASSDNWATAGNWKPSGVPSAADNVFIPSGLSRYPKITTPASVHAIYIAPGAALEGQHLLSADEWYTTVNIPTNRWVSLCPQLQNTYSGDFFTAEQGGTYSGPFAPAAYDGKAGSNGPNRTFPYAFYQRLFSTLVANQTAASYALYSFDASWSVPTNALGTKYPVGQGIQVWAPSANGDTTSLHFPSNATQYDWYSTNGNIVTTLAPVAVNHSASNKPAYQSNESNGAMEVTLTRNLNGEGGTPMFAIGNPAFGYMSIMEFLKENSVNKNTTPYLYAHTANTDGERDGTETIYYYNHDSQTLHTVTGSSETAVPTGTPGSAIANNAAYIIPGHGFRVMAGAAIVKCAEPALVGKYSCTSVMPEDLNSSPGTVGHYGSFTYTSNRGKIADSELSIAPGDNDHEVWLNNFVGQGSVKGYLNTANQTITIKGGEQVNFSDDNTYWYCNAPKQWTYYQNASSAIWRIYAVDNNATNKHIEVAENKFIYHWGAFKHEITTSKASNVSTSNDIIIKYTIVGTTVNFQCENSFAIYPDDITIFRSSTTTSVSSAPLFCASWNCYDSYTGTRTVTKGSTQYANTNLFGKYRYTISGKEGSGTGIYDNGKTVDFTIKPIAGLYNIVEISGMHPDAPTQSVIGIVNGNDIEIPAGQCIRYGTDIRVDYLYIYAWDNNTRKSFTMTFTGNTIKFTKRLQVSPLNAQNPQYYTKANHSCQRISGWDGEESGSTTITVGTNHASIHLRYLANMFTANPNAAAPKYTSGNKTSNVVGITAAQGDALVNTIIVKKANGNNGFSYLEDATMMDINDEAFALATIASENIVAINTIKDTTSVQLYIQNGNGDVELTFNNLQALGDNVRLYDAVNDTYTALNATNATTTVTIDVNDSPLRFSLVWDAPIIAGNELPLVDNNVDVFSPMQGTIRISAESNIDNVRIYNAAGMLVNSCMAVGQNTSFTNLTTGIYMVEVTTKNGTVVKKIDVK